jgi:LAS superfamily LD-carboxypeptidase LdcB
MGKFYLGHNQAGSVVIRLVIGVILLGLLVAGGYLVWQRQMDKKENQAEQNSSQAVLNSISGPSTGTELKQLTGKEFADLYNSFTYPNTVRIDEHTVVTGNEDADVVIRKIAVERGYRLQSAPVTTTFVEVEPTMLLQQKSAQPWLDLQTEAKEAGISISLSAAYRSADDQRTIFMDRLNSARVSLDAVAGGRSDAAIDDLLKMTAIPGFSRHHTGYTIDIACDDMPTTSFEYTNCFEWLSANNYEKTKKHGWIPSYPEGSGKQGPNPEAWEYVWVGTDVLTK